MIYALAAYRCSDYSAGNQGINKRLARKWDHMHCVRIFTSDLSCCGGTQTSGPLSSSGSWIIRTFRLYPFGMLDEVLFLPLSQISGMSIDKVSLECNKLCLNFSIYRFAT